MSTIASFPRSRRDHADDDAPGDEYGHRPCSRIGGTVDNGESVGSARHSAFVCNVGTRSFAARQTRPSDAFSRCRKGFSRSPCPAELRVQGPSSFRDPRSKVNDEADPKSLSGGTFVSTTTTRETRQNSRDSCRGRGDRAGSRERRHPPAPAGTYGAPG
jgi:hypothetical protein